MKYNTESKYPLEIDPLLFFHDITIKDLSFKEKYDECIHNQLYDEANTINYTDGKDTYTYSAGLFNLMVNRIKNTQLYISTKSTSPIREIMSSTSPTNIQIGQTWIAIDNN